MNDNSILDFGEYKGQKLANVPARYFLWLNKQHWCGTDLKAYIKENMDSFELEMKNDNDDNN